MTRLIQRLAVLLTFALLGVAPLAHAQATFTFFPNNTIINNVIINDYAIVGYAGGDFNVGFQTPSSPTVGVSAGQISNLKAYNSSTVNISGGDINFLSAKDLSTINISGGNLFSDLYADDFSTVSINGGGINYNLYASGNSEVNVRDGNIGFLNSSRNSMINISGGNINGLSANNFSIVNLSGGEINDLDASGNSIVNIRGGIIHYNVSADQNSLLNIFGQGLTAPLVDSNFANSLSLYSLSGTLLDGTVLANKNLFIRNGTGARFTLTNVPEPGSLLIGCASVLSLLVLRRRRR